MSQTHLVMNELQWLYHIHEGVVLKHAAATQGIRKTVSKGASQRCPYTVPHELPVAAGSPAKVSARQGLCWAERKLQKHEAFPKRVQTPHSIGHF